jgi:DNA repair exonuclease SbcCD ATPase subunit
MGTYTDKDGNTVEALTPAEVEEKLADVRAEAIDEANADRQAEIDDLNTQLAEKETALATEKAKDKNLSGQRTVIKDREEEIAGLKKTIEEVKADTSKKIDEIGASAKKKVVEDMIGNLVGDEKELKDKVQFFYDSFKGEPATEDERKQRINQAYILATGGRPANPFSASVISAQGGIPQTKMQTEGKLSPGVENVAHNLGIDDQELKKYNLI